MKSVNPYGNTKSESGAGSCARRLVFVAALATVSSASAFAQSSSITKVPESSSARLAIEPLTVIGPKGSGYLADPMPVHLAPGSDSRVQIMSGTTHAIIDCTYPISPGCFSWTPLSVAVGGDLQSKIDAAGATVTNFQNVDLFQDDSGKWHAAVTIDVISKSHPQHWTVVAHAHPTQLVESGLAPLGWSADTLLSGSFSDPAAGNYDAKYYEDGRQLYLLYVKNYVPEPKLRNEIVIQPMTSPTQPASVEPTVLLTPGDKDGGLVSEWYANTQAKLVEAPNIARINGKYALIYSTGAYLTSGYKAGVAWSDTLLPAPGHHYRKVLQPDVLGVWGTLGGLEVRYLVQSQKPRWPNFTDDQVIGPGVAAAVQSPTSVWWLYFNGFASNDMPVGNNGQVEGSHRRPYGLQLREAVPLDETVANASDAELATWLQPKTN